MEVIEAIRGRRSVRGFKPDPVPREVLEKLLDVCRWAPSPRNTQAWELAILGGKVMEDIRARLTKKVEAKEDPMLDIPPSEPPEPYLHRALEQRDAVDTHQFPPGTKNLQEKRDKFWVVGGRFHDAPNGIVFYAEKVLYPYVIFETGIMAQTICLAAPAFGLGTCIMRRPINWPDILRDVLGIPKSKIIIMAIAIGYPDSKALVNSYPRTRIPLGEFTTWHGF